MSGETYEADVKLVKTGLSVGGNADNAVGEDDEILVSAQNVKVVTSE